MRILNFGSLNIDHVYRVAEFVRPGETIAARVYEKFPGGKGCNQSIALARAGARVLHAGCVGTDGAFLRDLLESEKVDTAFLRTLPGVPSGHAVIQVADSGENSIVLFEGANGQIPEDLIDRALAAMTAGDVLLLQNEIARLPEIIEKAAGRGLKIAFNPAPMNARVLDCDLSKVDLFILNESEAAALADGAPPEELRTRFPRARILLTRGAQGAVYLVPGAPPLRIPAARPPEICDTTAAGDTFIGYFLAGCAAGEPPETALRRAAAAAALCISRPGAGVSIPRAEELC